MGSVTPQLIEEEARLERINTHAGERLLRIVGHAWRVRGLFEKRDDAVVLVNRHHAEAGGLGARHLDAADRHIGSRVNMLLEHQLVIHFIDMVARQDDHILGVVAPDDVDVLIHRIRGSGIPHAFVESAGSREECRSSRCARAGGNSSPAANAGSGCEPCTGSPPRSGGFRNSAHSKGQNRRCANCRRNTRRAWRAFRSAPWSRVPRPPAKHIGHRRPGDRS